MMGREWRALIRKCSFPAWLAYRFGDSPRNGNGSYSARCAAHGHVCRTCAYQRDSIEVVEQILQFILCQTFGLPERDDHNSYDIPKIVCWRFVHSLQWWKNPLFTTSIKADR
jgi:hypothetical protein